MNKKAFTTVELILTMVLVMIIMATITSVTYTYRDRSDYEAVITEVTNYKNTLTKIIYDDILNKDDRVVRIIKLDENNYNLITASDIVIPLTILKTDKVGIHYNGVDYIIPGSSDRLVSFELVDYYEDNINHLYKLDIAFSHRYLEEMFKIHLVIT